MNLSVKLEIKGEMTRYLPKYTTAKMFLLQKTE